MNEVAYQVAKATLIVGALALPYVVAELINTTRRVRRRVRTLELTLRDVER